MSSPQIAFLLKFHCFRSVEVFFCSPAILTSQVSTTFYSDFEQLFPVMDNLHKDVTKHVTHLEYIFLLHKSRLVTESEEKDRTKKEGVYKDVSVAVNSLSLHIKAAFYRFLYSNLCRPNYNQIIYVEAHAR